MTRVAKGRTLVYWLGQGFYLPYKTDRGIRWHLQVGQCAGSVWLDDPFQVI